jgi:putative transposase
MGSNQLFLRRHTRLAGWNYRSSHAYFITICTRARECVFGSVTGDMVFFSQRGIIARDCWLDIPKHHGHVELDAMVVMPNHLHGILLFVADAPSVVATPASPPSGPQPGSLGAVIGSYKSAVSRTINRLRPGGARPLWQQNYHEHIIRTDRAMEQIRDYIEANPQRWVQDEENPDGDGTDNYSAFVKSLLALEGPRDRREGDAGVAATKKDDDRLSDAGVATTERGDDA